MSPPANAIPPLPASELNFQPLLPDPVPRAALYRETGYHLWDPSVVRGDDGL